MLSVVTPAATTALTTVAAVKARLGLTGSAEDAYLAQAITDVTAQVVAFLGVARADDGTATLGREALSETLWLATPANALILSRLPAIEVAGIEYDGAAVDADTIKLSGGNGLVSRVVDRRPMKWPCGEYVVSYTAGWALPGDVDRDLPPDIEAAVIDLVKEERFDRTRDPFVRSVEVPDVETLTYGNAGRSSGTEDDPWKRLERYRVMWIG